MSKFVIFRWYGHWEIYVPDCNRDPVPLFNTFPEADFWLENYLRSHTELASKREYKILAIPTPLYQPNGDPV
jgi:hypothetical protein